MKKNIKTLTLPKDAFITIFDIPCKVVGKGKVESSKERIKQLKAKLKESWGA